MKAVIPVAGLGTRMLPMTKAVTKEMLPLVDKPLIQHIINEALLAGISELVLVIGPGQNLIKNYFGESPYLELVLEQSGKHHLLNEIQTLLPKNIALKYAYQHEAKGLGDAILSARALIGDEPFAILLPDVLINQYESDLAQHNLAAMVRRFEHNLISQIMVDRVPCQKLSKYGIVDCGVHNDLAVGESTHIRDLVEKPSIEDAPSNLAIVGRYVLSSKIWSLLEKTKPGILGEIQLTDALIALKNSERLEAYHLVGISHDCGDKAGYALAHIHYAMHHPETQELVCDYIKKQFHDISGSNHNAKECVVSCGI